MFAQCELADGQANPLLGDAAMTMTKLFAGICKLKQQYFERREAKFPQPATTDSPAECGIANRKIRGHNGGHQVTDLRNMAEFCAV